MSIKSFDKNTPFLASIKERYSLSLHGSQKVTHHVVLDLQGSGLAYEVGDSIGIYPQHHGKLIDCTLKAVKASGSEPVFLKNRLEPISLAECFSKHVNLTDIPPKLYKEVCLRQTNPEKKIHLLSLLDSGRRDAYKEYVSRREVWDFLSENEEVVFSVQEIIDHLMPLLPRFYSIASSVKVVGNEVHLAIASVRYHANGHERRGVCTHYLCHEAPLHEKIIPIFVQSSHNFRLPDDDQAPIIMIGPGTGVAPFRAFMQERIARGARGGHWLFFGERTSAYDFYYKDYWQELSGQGKLKLLTAFSRDQEHKVYVQHLMEEKGAELFRWLQEGAHLFVCGDANRMARDVDASLHRIVEEHGKMDKALAKAYVKVLKSEKRYLRDVY